MRDLSYSTWCCRRILVLVRRHPETEATQLHRSDVTPRPLPPLPMKDGDCRLCSCSRVYAADGAQGPHAPIFHGWMETIQRRTGIETSQRSDKRKDAGAPDRLPTSEQRANQISLIADSAWQISLKLLQIGVDSTIRSSEEMKRNRVLSHHFLAF